MTLAELLDELRRYVASVEAKASDGRHGEAPATAVATIGVDPASDVAHLRAGMAEVRRLLQRTGAALGAAGVAIVGGLGYTQVHQIFPFPADASSCYLVLALVGLVGAFLGATLLSASFFGAQRRILISTDGMQDSLDRRERPIKEWICAEHAQTEYAHTLRDVELRALRLQRIGRRSAEDADVLNAESDRLNRVVSIALIRTVATILERRAERAFRGPLTAIALALTILGIISVFGVADYAKGQRDLIDLRAKCAAAEAQGATGACAAVEGKVQSQGARATADCAATSGRQALSQSDAAAILRRYGSSATQANDYAASFGGPISLVAITPQTKFRRYFSDHHLIGRFLTTARFRRPVEAIRALHLPYANQADRVQGVIASRPTMALVGAIKNGKPSLTQTLILQPHCFDFGSGASVIKR